MTGCFRGVALLRRHGRDLVVLHSLQPVGQATESRTALAFGCCRHHPLAVCRLLCLHFLVFEVAPFPKSHGVFRMARDAVVRSVQGLHLEDLHCFGSGEVHSQLLLHELL